ncbi:N-formylglutamate amidohydrolase [Salipiger sp. 1_MG-2023]|uniref:N-formylglutamate amidohydrolase n=1 Tax=Salipiger sp. 1_MG-2023 TaxID=3062665 RepID=UPI0026E16C6B|nr:N-formylglutamate amidohydrolase [Salipiger sp. 1_MG-2023]MDO6588117.1 N-formylglutamate amidohydrolase [Salipiger sp. 1_MG-2023]
MLSAPVSLLSRETDPEPVETVAPTPHRPELPVLLVCEHAGKAVPTVLDGLGLEPGALGLHVAWDIGAGAVTRIMAQELGCQAVLQRYSRLVIDCNRPPKAQDAMPERSDGVPVPGNAALGAEHRQRRVDEIFTPYNDAVLAARRTACRILLSIHSFTPELRTKPGLRPWHIGFLCRKDQATSQALLDALAVQRPDLNLALNEPYQIDDESDWFVPAHGEASGLPHSLIEIRNDLIDTPEEQAEMAALLCGAVRTVLETQC